MALQGIDRVSVSENGYIPRQSWKAVGGITKQMWESPKFRRSVPVNEYDINNAALLSNSIVLLNCTKVAFVASVRIPKSRDLANQKANYREFQKEVFTQLLEPGTSSLYVTYPNSHALHISQVSQSSFGEKPLTPAGLELSSLEGFVIIIKNNHENAGGVTVDKQRVSNIGSYCIIKNQSSYDHFISLSDLNDSRIGANDTLSNKPDLGPNLKCKVKVPTKTSYHVYHPHTQFYISAIATDVDTKFPLGTLSTTGQIPSITEYVEYAVTRGSAGQVVAFFDTSDGGIEAASYDLDRCLKVSANLVVNETFNNNL